MGTNEDPLVVPASTHNTRVKGTHWLELVDKDGNVQQVHDNVFLRFDCLRCRFFFLTSSNPGSLKCPACGGVTEQNWQRVQVKFTLEIAKEPDATT